MKMLTLALLAAVTLITPAVAGECLPGQQTMAEVEVEMVSMVEAGAVKKVWEGDAARILTRLEVEVMSIAPQVKALFLAEARYVITLRDEKPPSAALVWFDENKCNLGFGFQPLRLFDKIIMDVERGA